MTLRLARRARLHEVDAALDRCQPREIIALARDGIRRRDVACLEDAAVLLSGILTDVEEALAIIREDYEATR